MSGIRFQVNVSQTQTALIKPFGDAGHQEWTPNIRDGEFLCTMRARDRKGDLTHPIPQASSMGLAQANQLLVEATYPSSSNDPYPATAMLWRDALPAAARARFVQEQILLYATKYITPFGSFTVSTDSNPQTGRRNQRVATIHYGGRTTMLNCFPKEFGRDQIAWVVAIVCHVMDECIETIKSGSSEFVVVSSDIQVPTGTPAGLRFKYRVKFVTVATSRNTVTERDLKRFTKPPNEGGDCRVEGSPYKAYRVAMCNAPTRVREDDSKKVYEDSTVFMPTTEVVMMM